MRKQLYLIMLLLLSAVLLVSCTKETNKSTEHAQVAEEVRNEKDDDLVTIQTKYFSVKIPKEWEELCICDIEETSVHFSHGKSYDYNCGGYIFGIAVEDLSFFQDTGDVEVLGGLTTPEGEKFNVWKLGPSDVQFSDETYEEYSKCMNEMENVLSTLSFNEGYIFTETPYGIEGNEYYMSNYVDFTQYGWPSTYDDSWIHFYNEGGEFYYNEDGEYFCEIYGTALYWNSSIKNWYYLNKYGDKFYRWNGTDYYVNGLSYNDLGYDIFIEGEWYFIDTYGVRKSSPPNEYVEYIESQREAASQSSFDEDINAWKNNFLYRVYQNENGIWTCEAPYGVWTYDPDYVSSFGLRGRWSGQINIDGNTHYVTVTYSHIGVQDITFYENGEEIARILDHVAFGSSWATVEEQARELPRYIE